MWLTVSQLASLLNISERAVRKAIVSGRYATACYETESKRGGNGGKTWRISIVDPAIPEEARVAAGYRDPRFDGLKKRLQEEETVYIAPEHLNEKSAKRLRVLRLASECPPDSTTGEWYAEIALREDVSVPTIYRWMAERKRGKVVSDRAPIDVVVSANSGPLSVALSSRSFAPQALEYGLSLLAKNPSMEVKHAYRETVAEAERQGWECGSLASFYRRWNEIPDAVKLLGSSGKRGLEAAIKPAIVRDLSVYRVYEVLVGDQHIFDHTVLDDDGQPIRPQMFCWGDVRSRYISGVWPVMGDYDKYAVGFALREACRWGIPETLYTDWGRPERSDYVAHLRKQMSGYAAFASMDESDEIMPHRKAKPRNAQAKPIESWFRWAFEEPLKRRDLPGYSRQDKKDEKRNEFIQAALRKSIKSKNLLSAREYFEIVAQIVEEWNDHAMIEGIVPRNVFAEGIERTLPRLDPRTLDFLFLPAIVRQVRKSTVEMTLPGWGKCRWFAPELSALEKRGKKVKVEVRFNPYDPGAVHCLDLESHSLICTAERWEKIDPRDDDVVVAKIRRQNELVKHWIELRRQLAKIEPKVRRFTPYAPAASEAVELRTAKEERAVDDAALNRKIIDLAQRLRKEELPRAKES